MSHSGRRYHRAVRALLVAALLLACRPGGAAELAAFVSGAPPGPKWSGTGFGLSLTITLLNLVGVELEGARQGGAVTDSNMLSASGRAFLAPPLGRFVPYGGLAVGAYRQTLGSRDQWGTV